MPRRVKQFIVKSISTTTRLSDSLQDWEREFEGGKKLTETKYLFDDDVLTIQMNRPEKLNGWTLKMMSEINELFKKAAAEPKVKVLILTGLSLLTLEEVLSFFFGGIF